MSAAEDLFDGAPVAHIVQREEHRLLARKAEEARQLVARRHRSPLRPTRDQADAAHLPLFVAGNEPGLL